MKRQGFTLAEVLITLGIIGVIAALTLPNLIAQHKKQTWVTQLRKTVSTLEQGFQKMRADAGGVDSLEDTEAFMKMRSNEATYGECHIWNLGTDAVCDDLFKNYMPKYFNIVDYPISPSDYVYNFRNDSGADTAFDEFRMIFADGSVIGFDFTIGRRHPQDNNVQLPGVVHIDVNGFKAPNTYGYDVFLLGITPTGNLVDWREADYCVGDTASAGDSGCYNYLARNGWKMDY